MKYTCSLLFRAEVPPDTTDWWHVGFEPIKAARCLNYQEPVNKVLPQKDIPEIPTFVDSLLLRRNPDVLLLKKRLHLHPSLLLLGRQMISPTTPSLTFKADRDRFATSGA